MSTAEHSKPLGRNEPPDREHETKYPLASAPPTQPVPVVAGTFWYPEFDKPEAGADGRYRVPATITGKARGGHCYCLEPLGEPDTERAWVFYDQQREGACEGFGHSRAMTMLHRNGEPLLLDGFWLYDDARRQEGRYPDGEGATNRGTAKALQVWGAHPDDNPGLVIEREPWQEHARAYPIHSYHWASSADEVRQALGYDASVGEVPILNSWGRDGYPHRVYMPLELIGRLKDEEGEYSVLQS
jgi:hypothetical protein